MKGCMRMDRIFSLDGQWTLFYANEENVPPSSPKELECLRLPCIPAEVPGNVELDLSRAGLLPADLYWGMNPWLAEAYEAYGWWYRTEFDTPPAEPGERLFLRFEGGGLPGGVHPQRSAAGHFRECLYPP